MGNHASAGLSAEEGLDEVRDRQVAEQVAKEVRHETPDEAGRAVLAGPIVGVLAFVHLVGGLGGDRGREGPEQYDHCHDGDEFSHGQPGLRPSNGYNVEMFRSDLVGLTPISADSRPLEGNILVETVG